MRLRILVLLGLLLAASPAFAQKVYIDYDKNYDFDSIQSFRWFESKETSVASANPLMHSRIVNAIEHYLTSGDMREALETGDSAHHWRVVKQNHAWANRFEPGVDRGWRGASRARGSSSSARG